MSLQHNLWTRIEEVLEAKELSIDDLRSKIERNKNTFTNWKTKPNIRVSDIEVIAAALEVHPDELFRRNGQPPQLELPLEQGQRIAVVELECRGSQIVLRRPAGRSKSGTSTTTTKEQKARLS